MTQAAEDTRRSLGHRPGVEALVVGALVLFGYRIGLKGISDNSAFVHIRTGIEMFRNGSIPRVDPYSFTAPGHPWVVQSWLASGVYGAAYQVGKLHLLVIVNGLVAAALAWTLATLARTGSAVRTMASATLAVVGGSVYWAPRPLMFGLIAFALLILVVERRASWWWLLPVGWIWVNTHGSFPLGLGWLAARTVGEAVDAKGRPRWIEPYVLAFTASLALGAVNPLGPRLLSFPLAVRDKQSVFKNVVEWHSPNFQTTEGLFTAACLGLAFLILLQRRALWADILPVVGFLVLGLLSLRNISPEWVVLAPALGRAMRRQEVVEPSEPTVVDMAVTALDPPRRRARPASVAIAGVLVVAALIFTVDSHRTHPLDLRGYPTLAEDYMVHHGLLDPSRHRVAAQDVVGCYLILLRGRNGRVFIDDRVDMYPVAVSTSYDDLLHGSIDAPSILSRYGADVVLWDRRLALPSVLKAAGGWRAVYPEPGAPSRADPRWTVLVRDDNVLRSS